nr:MAG TPA: hypothetical protein [Caudoviricetes sp.]
MALGKSTQEFINFSRLEVSAETNGYQGGDAKKGGYLKVKFKDLGATNWNCNVDGYFEEERINLPNSVELIFRGDSEIENFYESIKHIKEYLDKKLERLEF